MFYLFYSILYKGKKIERFTNKYSTTNKTMSGTVDLDDIKLDTNYETQGVAVGTFLQNLETKRRNLVLLVPTNDDDVKAALRAIGEPITYFGEDKGDRRERLKQLVIERDIDLSQYGFGEEQNNEDEEMADDEEFYTPGSVELVHARKFIAKYSLERAQSRLSIQREQAQVSFAKELTRRRQLNEKLAKYELYGSQLVSTRAASYVTLNKQDQSLLTGSWAGEIKLLSSDLQILKEFQTVGKVSGLDFSPISNHFISSADQLELWSLDQETPLTKFEGHEDHRITRSKFHPSGNYIASASFDMTWRLWDVETQQQLLLQEGHSKEVYTVSFHPDGSLIASAGLDAIGHVWDLRTGSSIMLLEGHIKPIYGLDWRSNGYHIATGSADGSIKIWDLRNTKEEHTIPAHNKIVSEVKFQDDVLVSASYDGTLKLYSCDNWVSVSTLEGHGDKVMSVDLNDEFIVSSGWDRSVKKWST